MSRGVWEVCRTVPSLISPAMVQTVMWAQEHLHVISCRKEKTSHLFLKVVASCWVKSKSGGQSHKKKKRKKYLTPQTPCEQSDCHYLKWHKLWNLLKVSRGKETLVFLFYFFSPSSAALIMRSGFHRILRHMFFLFLYLSVSLFRLWKLTSLDFVPHSS